MSNPTTPAAVLVDSPGTAALILNFDPVSKYWVFRCDFASRHYPKDAGFQWHKDSQSWYTADPFSAMKLIHYADPSTRAQLAKYWNVAATTHQDSSLQSSHSRRDGDAGISIPAPNGMTYMDYQRIGIEFLVRDDPRCSNTLLGDDMGLGKTIQIIGAINYLSDGLAGRRLGRVIIVCPASLKLNWGRELRKWLVGPLTWGIADPKYYPRNRDIVVINYDIMEKWMPLITASPVDLLVLDEAHYLKNPGTKRARAIFGHKAKKPEDCFPGIQARKRMYATGTPIVNRPKELYSLVHSLDPEQFPSLMSYGIRYCGGYKTGSNTWDFSGNSNLEELQSRLRATIMIRRLKGEVLKELPPKTRNIIELPAPRNMVELIKQELGAFQQREPALQQLRAARDRAKAASNTQDYLAAVESLKKETDSLLGQIASLRREVAERKAPIVVDYLESLWADDPERKIVLWCHHHTVMNIFLERFKYFTTKVTGEQKLPAYGLKFSGEQSLAERDDIVQRFQNDPRCLLFIGQISAGGVGITLTAASHAIFAELDWVPGNVTQAEDRCHRIGQKDNVLVEHLVMEGSLDCRIAERLVQKQRVIDVAMNNPSAHLKQHSMFGE